MQIERVEIQGFRSFRDLEVFDFSDEPGLIYLTGRNEDQPSLGRNGAGKSSMWDAVYWCLYGIASTGLQGPEVATWETGAGIYVHVRIKGRRITRTWKNNSLLIDGEEATQDDVVDVVGLTREQFLFCAYMAQDADSFLDLAAPAKTDLLASVLDLDKWLAYSEAAARIAKEHETELQGVSEELVRARAVADELAATNYIDASVKWRRQRQESLDEIEAAMIPAREELEDVKAEVERSVRRVAVIRNEIEDELRQRIERADKFLSQADTRVASTEHYIKQIKARTGNCPTCDRPWPHDHNNSKAVKDLTAQLEDQVADAEEAKAALDEVRAELRGLEDTLRDRTDALNNHRREQDRIEQTLQELARRAQALRSERDPFVAMVLDREERLGRLIAKVQRLEVARDKERTEHERALYWVKGYKDVRLFLVAEALAQLEVEANSALVQLGLIGWEIRFAPDSETKGGNVKRGFSVTIKSPSNTRPVPWKVWSGGEAQRLRLGAAMGLSNLISAYTGYRPFVEVWDEPSDGMSPEGIKDMLATLARRAATNNRQVWVVDHSALESGAFVETVTAVKRDGTTTLERIEHGQGE